MRRGLWYFQSLLFTLDMKLQDSLAIDFNVCIKTTIMDKIFETNFRF